MPTALVPAFFCAAIRNKLAIIQLANDRIADGPASALTSESTARIDRAVSEAIMVLSELAASSQRDDLMGG